MTKPYSLDLRERVTERVAAGDSVRAVATIFTVSVASVVRWSPRLRRTGQRRVSIKRIGLPRASKRALILVVSPPRERPIACAPFFFAPRHWAGEHAQ